MPRSSSASTSSGSDITTYPSARWICGTNSFVKGSSTRALVVSLDFQHVARAEIVNGADLAEHAAFAILRAQPYQISVIEFVLLRRRQRFPRYEKLLYLQALRRPSDRRYL